MGGLLAATGAFAFVAIAVKSVFFGEPIGPSSRAGSRWPAFRSGLTHPPVHAADVDAAQRRAARSVARNHGADAGHGRAGRSSSSPRSSLYFFMNWKILSFLWRIG